MEQTDLQAAYASREFVDCTFVSADGVDHPAHLFVIRLYPRLKELVVHAVECPDCRVHLTESEQVVDRMLQWMYGVEWASRRVGTGADLMDIMGLCDAAEKVSQSCIIVVLSRS